MSTLCNTSQILIALKGPSLRAQTKEWTCLGQSVTMTAGLVVDEMWKIQDRCNDQLAWVHCVDAFCARTMRVGPSRPIRASGYNLLNHRFCNQGDFGA